MKTYGELRSRKAILPSLLFNFLCCRLSFSFELFVSSGGWGDRVQEVLLDIQSAYPKLAQYHSSLKSQLTQFCLQKKWLQASQGQTEIWQMPFHFQHHRRNEQNCPALISNLAKQLFSVFLISIYKNGER